MKHGPWVGVALTAAEGSPVTRRRAYFARLVAAASAGLGWDPAAEAIGGEGFIGALLEIVADALSLPPTCLLAVLLFIALKQLGPGALSGVRPWLMCWVPAIPWRS